MRNTDFKFISILYPLIKNPFIFQLCNLLHEVYKYASVEWRQTNNSFWRTGITIKTGNRIETKRVS